MSTAPHAQHQDHTIYHVKNSQDENEPIWIEDDVDVTCFSEKYTEISNKNDIPSRCSFDHVSCQSNGDALDSSVSLSFRPASLSNQSSVLSIQPPDQKDDEFEAADILARVWNLEASFHTDHDNLLKENEIENRLLLPQQINPSLKAKRDPLAVASRLGSYTDARKRSKTENRRNAFALMMNASKHKVLKKPPSNEVAHSSKRICPFYKWVAGTSFTGKATCPLLFDFFA